MGDFTIYDGSNPHIEAALRMVSDTRCLRLGEGVIGQMGDVFTAYFSGRSALIVADTNTFAAAGKEVIDALTAAGVQVVEPLVFDEPDPHAHISHVERIEQRIGASDAIPIAVGSGTINDVAKLAAHRCGRAYIAVGTAASMDGYTSFGASIIADGAKQTFFCPAPIAVIADLAVITQAPSELNAAGYGDLLAKIPAGADWILAATLASEPIEPQAWSLVQDHLRAWASNPAAIRRGEPQAIAGLLEGLVMTGFAMQWSKSSRPAAGAEHQFSHLWDMCHHRHQGGVPLHGAKVAVGMLASTRLYEALLAEPLHELDVPRVCAGWPSLDEVEELVRRTHDLPEVRAVAWREMQAKYLTRDQLAQRLERLKAVWPDLRKRLQQQLIPSDEIAQMLHEVGAPDHCSRIGIDVSRLRRSHHEAWQIRSRFTVLDLAAETGLMDTCLDRLFGPGGAWAGGR
ncbi:MAG: sn-glycerol-1-phosphate dehydrogenase [Phycisphaerae bacterium]|nr:sn-glycerol-1-phosphate dehydrogenase [Phycisphaerae bacterium]